MRWRGSRFQFEFPRPALVMGIVNVTPDSFSDGGRFLDVEAAVRHGVELAAAGADLLDIGGESTRPGSEPVGEEEERRRVLPVIERLVHEARIPISIDTTKATVAREAIQAGAAIVNDVGAAEAGREMLTLVAEARVGYVAMHRQGTPATMQLNPTYENVVQEVGEFFRQMIVMTTGLGIHPDQLALDVGIGFGKSVEHNLELLARMSTFAGVERPLVLGVSRKSFIGHLTGAPVDRRLAGGIAASCMAVASGVSVIRTHDVAETVQALRVTEAILARRS